MVATNRMTRFFEEEESLRASTGVESKIDKTGAPSKWIELLFVWSVVLFVYIGLPAGLVYALTRPHEIEVESVWVDQATGADHHSYSAEWGRVDVYQFRFRRMEQPTLARKGETFVRRYLSHHPDCALCAGKAEML